MTTPGSSTPRRKAELSALRRLSRTVLILGTVVAVIAAFGPLWAVRAGVLVAVAAAIVSCVAAWRELTDARHQHAAEMLAASKAHGSALSEERRHNASVVETLTGRTQAATAQVQRAQTTIAELRGTIVRLRSEITSLNGSHARAQDAIRERESEIACLRQTVRAREAELLALSEANGQVRSIPRRVLTEHESEWEQVQAADQLWPEGSHPTVADLVDVPVVLPNYEGERRLA